MSCFRDYASKPLLGLAVVLATALALPGFSFCCAKANQLQRAAGEQPGRVAGTWSCTQRIETCCAVALAEKQPCYHGSPQVADRRGRGCSPCSSSPDIPSAPTVQARPEARGRTVRQPAPWLLNGCLDVGLFQVFGQPLAAGRLTLAIPLSAAERCTLLCRLQL